LLVVLPYASVYLTTSGGVFVTSLGTFAGWLMGKSGAYGGQLFARGDSCAAAGDAPRSAQVTMRCGDQYNITSAMYDVTGCMLAIELALPAWCGLNFTTQAGLGKPRPNESPSSSASTTPSLSVTPSATPSIGVSASSLSAPVVYHKLAFNVTLPGCFPDLLVSSGVVSALRNALAAVGGLPLSAVSLTAFACTGNASTDAASTPMVVSLAVDIPTLGAAHDSGITAGAGTDPSLIESAIVASSVQTALRPSASSTVPVAFIEAVPLWAAATNTTAEAVLSPQNGTGIIASSLTLTYAAPVASPSSSPPAAAAASAAAFN